MDERTLNELERLAKLKERGVLSEEELAEHKKILLSGSEAPKRKSKSVDGSRGLNATKVMLLLALLILIVSAGYYFGIVIPRQEDAARADRARELEIQEEQLKIQRREQYCNERLIGGTIRRDSPIFSGRC